MHRTTHHVVAARPAAVGWALLAVAALGGCGGRPETPSPEPVVVYPPPPDTARIQFLVSLSSELDFPGRGPSLLDRLIGRKPAAKAIARPYGLAVHGGKLYVCDQLIMGLDIVDLERGQIAFFQPPDPYSLRRPGNCFVDAEGMLYVTDLGKRRVAIYRPDGAFAGAVGDEDGGNPADVFVTGDRLYVSHLGAGLGVRVYDRATRERRFSFPRAPGGDSTGLVAPANLFVAGGEVYVSDMLKQRVLVYGTDGRYRRAIGRPGLGPSTFTRPKGVAVDRDGLVYVVDAAFENVQIFRPDGRLLTFFGGPGAGPGDLVVPAKVVLDYDHLRYFQRYVRPGFELKYLIFVTNQYGNRKINVYGFIGPGAAMADATPRR